MRVITIANNKGGVAKTTSVVSIGAGLAEAGRKVLLIDLDPQSNLTQIFGIQARRTTYGSMRGDYPLTPVEVLANLYIVPSELSLSGIEEETKRRRDRGVILKGLISEIKGFDYILIDTPPSLGFIPFNAFTASTEVFIPMTAEPLSLNGASALTREITGISSSINPQLRISGVFITRYDNRQTIQRQIAETIAGAFGERAFKTRIRNNVSLMESTTSGKSIFQYAPRSNGAQDYRNLCKEIISQEKRNVNK